MPEPEGNESEEASVRCGATRQQYRCAMFDDHQARGIPYHCQLTDEKVALTDKVLLAYWTDGGMGVSFHPVKPEEMES